MAASSAAAAWLAEVIERARRERGHAVLGLPTGSTPKAVYAELVKRHRAGTLSFEDVTTYNLDEYYPVSPLDPRSYRFYMHEHLFRHVDISPAPRPSPRRHRSRGVRLVACRGL